MGPNFKDPVLVSPLQLKIEGRFDTHGEVIGNVMIGYLIVPDGIGAALTAPIVGTVELPHADLTTTTPDPANPDVKITSGEFVKADVSNAQFNLVVNAKVRVIGLSVAVKAGAPPVRTGQPQDAPAFETFTWCVDRIVIAP
jgi:hypothetical protein